MPMTSAVGGERPVAEERNLFDSEGTVEIVGAGIGREHAGRCAGTCTERLHLGVDGFDVHFYALLRRDFGGHLDGEAVCVVKADDGFTGDVGIARGFGFGDDLIKHSRALVEGGLERFLLALQDVLHERQVAVQFGVDVRHLCGGSFGDLWQDGAREAEFSSEEHAATNDASKDVSPARVAGNDTVGDEERRRTSMLSDDADGAVGLLIIAVSQPSAIGNQIDQGTENVGFVNVVFPLEDLYRPLQTHSGVDVLLRQQFVVALAVTVVLSEDEVVEL